MDIPILEIGDYRIFRADSEWRQSEVEGLIRRMYSWRGYGVGISGSPRRGANDTTLQVCRGDELTVATMTVRFDSKDGLLAEDLYPDEVQGVRNKGGKVCEMTGLAISPREETTLILNALFQSAHLLGRDHKVTDVFAEVNPRHASHYQRLLGFKLIGKQRICPRVAAPAVLLHLPLPMLLRHHDGSVASRPARKRIAEVAPPKVARQPYASYYEFAAAVG
jgi:hypothetical protein